MTGGKTFSRPQGNDPKPSETEKMLGGEERLPGVGSDPGREELAGT